MSVKIMSVVWETPCRSHTEKLVLLALADNADDSGHCWPGLDHLAAKCDLSRQGVIDQIASLAGQGLIAVSKKAGMVNRYTVQPVNAVDPSTRLTRQRGGLLPVNAVDPHPSTRLTTPVNAVDPNHQEPSVEPSVEPSRSALRLEAPPVPEKKPRAEKQSPDTDTIAEIYEAYPRKVGRASAFKAIGKALKKIPAAELLTKVKAYAASRAGQDETYTPHPATWFNGERWADSQSSPSPSPINGAPVAKQPQRLRFVKSYHGGAPIPVNPDPYAGDNLKDGCGDPHALKDAQGESYGPFHRNPAHRWGTSNLGVPMPVNGGPRLATDDEPTRRARVNREATCEYL
jgi:hypothetical protein